jgi:predicted ATPase
MTEQKLNNGLEELVRAELIFRRGFPPHAEYTFKHALVQDAAYSVLLRARRHGLHASIAQVLVVQFPDRAENEPELLAHHFAEAGFKERAIDYWLKAGQHAMAVRR